MSSRACDGDAQDLPTAMIRGRIVAPNQGRSPLLVRTGHALSKDDHGIELLCLGLVDVHHMDAAQVLGGPKNGVLRAMRETAFVSARVVLPAPGPPRTRQWPVRLAIPELARQRMLDGANGAPPAWWIGLRGFQWRASAQSQGDALANVRARNRADRSSRKRLQPPPIAIHRHEALTEVISQQISIEVRR